MTRAYLDTNFLYVHLRQPAEEAHPRAEEWRRQAIESLGSDAGVISALVVDELAYRMLLAWLRDEGDPDPLSSFRRSPGEVVRRMRGRLGGLWKSLDRLRLEFVVTDTAVVDRAKALMTSPGLAPRDAFHAGHALLAGCELVISSDPAFDRIPRLRRLGPP